MNGSRLLHVPKRQNGKGEMREYSPKIQRVFPTPLGKGVPRGEFREWISAYEINYPSVIMCASPLKFSLLPGEGAHSAMMQCLICVQRNSSSFSLSLFPRIHVCKEESVVFLIYRYETIRVYAF